jgi:hypothetical protein
MKFEWVQSVELSSTQLRKALTTAADIIGDEPDVTAWRFEVSMSGQHLQHGPYLQAFGAEGAMAHEVYEWRASLPEWVDVYADELADPPLPDDDDVRVPKWHDVELPSELQQ